MPTADHPESDWQRRLLAARGYCELGLPDEAWAELEPVAEQAGHQLEFIETELAIRLQLSQWREGLSLALRLRALQPAHPAGYIQAAYCLHELGRTKDALALLQGGPKALRQEAIFHYNLACYHAVQGEQPEALKSLRQAFKLDPAYRSSARRDPDLVSLREQI